MKQSIRLKTNLGREFDVNLRRNFLRMIVGWEISLHQENSKSNFYPGSYNINSPRTFKGKRVYDLIKGSRMRYLLYGYKELTKQEKEEVVVEVVLDDEKK